MTRSEVVTDNNVAYYHAYKYSSLPDLQRKYHYQDVLQRIEGVYDRGTGRLPCPEMKRFSTRFGTCQPNRAVPYLVTDF